MENNEIRMFVGVKTNEKLRDRLDSSATSMKPFFNDNNSEFLQIIRIDDSEYIGKVIDSGATLENLNNIFMNVKTMLKMICPGFIISDDVIRIMALQQMPSRVFC